MTLAGLSLNIGILLALIGGLVALKYSGALDVILHAFGWVKVVMSWLMTNKIFAIPMFLFLITISGVVVTFIIGLNYACTSDNTIQEQNLGVIGGLTMFIVGANENFNGTNNESYDSFIGNWTTPRQEIPENDARNTVAVNCYKQQPKLLLFNKIDILNYKMWILIMLISLIMSIIFKLK